VHRDSETGPRQEAGPDHVLTKQSSRRVRHVEESAWEDVGEGSDRPRSTRTVWRMRQPRWTGPSRPAPIPRSISAFEPISSGQRLEDVARLRDRAN
jgi:hypothetical protein